MKDLLRGLLRPGVEAPPFEPAILGSRFCTRLKV